MEKELLKSRYDEVRAKNYNAERAKTRRWKLENEYVSKYLRDIKPTTVLDVPIGTGRFVHLYRDLGVDATGVDASESMLEQADSAASENDQNLELKVGDIFSLKFSDSNFDAVVCMRFLNWINYSDLVSVLTELGRVAQKDVIIGIEYYESLGRLGFTTLLGLQRLFLQFKRKFFMWRTRDSYVYHSKSNVLAAFDIAKLAIHGSSEIGRNRDEGIVYQIYWLQRAE